MIQKLYPAKRSLQLLLVASAALFLHSSSQAQIISTIAGVGNVPGFYGDGGPAVSAGLNRPTGIYMNSSGVMYIADNNNQCVRKLSPSGILTTIAGNVTAGYSGDGGPATLASLNRPCEVIDDAAGNVYVTDAFNNVIRKINTFGVISTYAGTGVAGYSGDGGPASLAKLNQPSGLAIDGFGNMYVGDGYNQVIRKINMSTGTISTYAGDGTAGYIGDGGPASIGRLNYPNYLHTDAANNLYITDNGNHCIRKVTPGGIISTVAGNGSAGYTGDGGPATLAQLNFPAGTTTDAAGNLYIADNINNVVRKVTPSGTISTFAGTGVGIFGGDGGLALLAGMNEPKDLTSDGFGNIYIADYNSSCVRKVTFVNTAPSFTGGAAQNLSVCQNIGSLSNPISSLLSITDPDIGQTETWGVVTGAGAVHGIVGATYSTTSIGGTITPIGLSYTPTTGYVGLDSFKITVGDGVGADTITIYVTVNPLPSAILGPLTVCQGGTTSLSDVTSGGAWSSSPVTVATVGSSGASAGVVFGIPTGSLTASVATITYQITSTGCRATRTITVNPSPAISGASAVCQAGSLILLETTGLSGTWSSSASATASVTSLGIVSGLTAGIAEISYTAALGGCSAIKSVTVNPLPALISGPLTVCHNSTVTLTDGDSGGTWSSSNTAIATIGTSGDVFGVLPGTSTISYTFSTTGCRTTTMVTVAPLPSIVGPSAVCLLSTILLSESTGTIPGTWSSAATTIATASGGAITGAGVGTTTITFTSLAGSCIATKSITVNAIPSNITGGSTICAGATTTLSDITSGGAWSSSPVTVATVSGGVVSSLVTGSAIPAGVNISYTIPATGCFVTRSVTVNPQPDITGSTHLCEFSNMTLVESTGAAGAWSGGSTTVASVSSTGLVTALAVGTTRITYTATTGGCSDVVTVTVNPLPAIISGPSNMCNGSSATVSDITTGGNWSVTPLSLAAISTSGVVTGVASISTSATATVTYTVLSSGCFLTHSVVINPQPVITGPSSVCELASVSLYEATGTAGAWSSSSTAIASVTGGVTTGVSAGTVNISYVASTGGCAGTKPMNVNPNPASITGASSVCQFSTTTLADADGGGVWTSSNNALATVAAGIVTGVFPGSPVISYTFPTTGCFVTAPLTVLLAPTPVITPMGPTAFCPGGSVTLNASAGYSYQWYNNGTLIPGATNMSYTALTTGSVTVGATNSSGCYTESPSIFVAASAAPVINTSGLTTFCYGNSITLTANTGGAAGTVTYQWQKNGIDITGANAATYSAFLTGIYTCSVVITDAHGTCSGVTPSLLVTTLPLPTPAVNVVGNTFVTPDHSFITYQWYFNTAPIPGANSWVIVPTLAGSYRLGVTDTAGCTGYSTSLYFAGTGLGSGQLNNTNVQIYPNPASGIVHIAAPGRVSATITSIDGRELLHTTDVMEINVSGLADGIYIITLYDDNGNRLMVQKLLKESGQ